MRVCPRNLSPAQCSPSLTQPASRELALSSFPVPARAVKAKLLLIVSGTPAAWSALWTFPSMLASAFLVAWAAEAAQFIISQGLALAILAWVQTLPEFAVEAVIAWEAGGDAAHCFVSSPPPGCHSHLGDRELHRRDPSAGGSRVADDFFRRRVLRAEAASRSLARSCWRTSTRSKCSPRFRRSRISCWIWHKASIDIIDAVVLIAMYCVYLAILWRMPPRQEEEVADAPRIARWAATRPGRQRVLAVGGLFAIGAALIYFTAHPFLESMLAIAGTVGVSQFVLVQWVAPFLSEFPGEGVGVPVGEPRAHGADGAREHGVEQHQSVDRARGDDSDRVLALARHAVRAPVRRCAARRRFCSRSRRASWRCSCCST